ncbi:prepilin-type N-terminal cleavage/methylation domain-containing protein [Cylindrospermum stagnale PCC 7417]|uniref:Prepilin-type N-terminal cleavage/methylation domain-containing protein n=1 Tax=Cylindrospermum stagnale PCC 7417 TaxID=56107 RepID=K9X6G0_9NOST|nr:type II secretion system protein [Cylindrospermum stagnale]AFZ27661.1 prepilin-type N-terminal cleavage/methylation domain-containing protein [Cylindrospermum stagnale PCC 7417]
MNSSIALKALRRYLRVGIPYPSDPYLMFSRRYSGRFSQANAGFSLIEMIVVMVMVGILGAIAVPSWLGFVNRQRVNKANNAVVTAIQEAQRQAKIKKLKYSVSFRNDITNGPQIALHPDSVDASTLTNAWQTLGSGLELKPGQIWIGTNITGNNLGGSVVNPLTTTATDIKTIAFDNNGTLPINATTPLKIVVAIPRTGSPTQASGVKRCVSVQTLLGGMRTEKDSACDANNSNS